MAYRISTLDKKSVHETTRWTKDGRVVDTRETYRWGYIIVKDKPDFSGYDPEVGIDVYSEFEIVDHEFRDGDGIVVEYSENVSDEEIEHFIELLENLDGVIESGWTEDDTTLSFHGPLEVEEF